MGLLTLLTGKDRMTRQLEKLDKGINEKFFKIASHNHTELGLKSAEEVTTASSAMTVGVAVNHYLTHYVRTQLSNHYKRLSDGNFNEEAPPLITTIAVHFRVLCRSNMDVRKKMGFVFMMTDIGEDPPPFSDLIQNMFKSADLERLLKIHPEETKRGMSLMRDMHSELALKSSHEFCQTEFVNFLHGLIFRYESEADQ